MQAFHFKSFRTDCHENGSDLSTAFSGVLSVLSSAFSPAFSCRAASSFSEGSGKKRSLKSRTRYSVRLGGGEAPMERSSPSEVSEPRRQRSSLEEGQRLGEGGTVVVAEGAVENGLGWRRGLG